MGIIPSWYQVASYVRTFATGIGIRLYGATSGFVGLKPPASPDSTEYTLPASAPTVNGQALVGTTAGVMSWASIGMQGAQGIQGFQGNQGNQGWQGERGFQGLIGYQGNQGLQGPQGLQGLQGLQGNQGNQGLLGLQGVQGWQGYGDTGAQGPQGWQGLIGSQGGQGVQGTAGENSGLYGPQGAQGAAGLDGAAGNTGAQGAQGNLGNQGPQGNQGFDGNQGPQGAQGYQGRQGLQGLLGLIGIQGAQGITGLQGNQGIQGSQGWQGGQGTVGYFGPQGPGPQGYQGSAATSGLIPNGSATATSQTTTSSTYVDIPGLTFNVTSETSCPIVGVLTLYTQQTGTGASDVGAFRVVCNATNGEEHQLTYSGNDVQYNVACQATSASLPPGTYTIKAQYRRVSGDRTIQVNSATLSGFAYQGAIGPQGVVGAQGVQGNQGWQGEVGAAGSAGAQGNQGWQGWQGGAGGAGVQGAQGWQGWQGSVGTGAQGAQGSAGGGGSDQWESTGGVFQAKTTAIASGDQFKLVSRESDGATQVAHILDTENSFTTAGGKLVSIKNATTEQSYFNQYGDLAVLGQDLGANGRRATIYLYGVRLDNSGSSANFDGLRVSMGNTPTGTFYESFRSVYGIVSVADVGNTGDSAFKVKARSSAYAYTNSGYFLDATQYYDGDSYLNKSATTDGEMRWYYDGVKSLAWSDKTTTTDNTITTIINETISDNTVHVIEALVVGRRTDAAGRWSGRRRFTVYRAGGGATVEGVAEPLGTDVANGLTPTITCDTNSNDWRVRVTSENSKTVAWRVYIEKVHV